MIIYRKKFNLRFPSRALSLIQTLIGLGIAGLVMVFAFSIGSKFFRPSKLSEAMLALTNKSLVIKESLQEIFQEAPRINGDSAALFPPIARWNDSGTAPAPAAREATEEFDSIVVFAHPNAASIPLVVPPIPQTAPRWLINIPIASDQEVANNLARYFENSLKRKPDQLLYSLTRLNQIDVIQKFVVTNSLSSSTALSYPFDAPTANINFEDGAYLLRELARYDIFVRNGDLIAIQNSQNSRGSRERVIATGVERFQVDFIFNDPDAPQANPVFVSHPKPPTLCEAGNCPNWTWADLAGLRVSLRLASKDRFAADSLVDQTQGFELDSDGRLIYDFQFRIPLPNFELGEMDVTAEDLENCPPSDPNSRCRDQCQSVFNNPNPNHPRWEGYGDLNSNYCQCGILAGGIVGRPFVSPDFSEILGIIDNWTPGMTPGHLAALEACVRHFGPCDPRWRAKDVRAQVICDCTYNTDEFVTGNLSDFEVNYPAGQEELPPLRCNFWQTCRNRLNAWFEPDPNPNVFTEECGCLFLEQDENGAPMNARIAERDYARLCNPTTCDENFEGGLRRVRNPNQLAQRFLLAEATFCECGAQLALPNFSRAAEFRQPRVDDDPAPTQGGIPQDGSRAPILTTAAFNYEFNGASPTQIAGQNCAEAQCNSLGWSVGCCITPPMPEGFPATATFQNHGTYCRGDCNFVTAARNLVRDDLRRVILGLEPNQALPPFCGGTANNNTGESTIGQ